ncbi:MAG TPA: fatty acid desaturase [Steroidobacteraceae bacterium]|nr:fatty acid desaturase [Steroidobacteraceae bacterium]
MQRLPATVRDASWPDAEESLHFTQQSTWLALAIATAELAAVLAFIALAVSPLPLILNLVAAIIAGLLIGTLFTVGHDACHQSFTPHRLLNDWIGRIAFIPSAHARSLWILGHNRIHHGYTNLRGRDYVWEPMSPDAYRRAALLRRAIYRLYRSRIGAFPYYLVEMWWKKNFLPIAPEARSAWRRHLFDSGFVVVAWLGFGAAIGWLGTELAPARPLWEALLLGWILPFLVFNWTIGWIIYVHHTHPEVPWWDDAGEWRASRPQIAATLSVRLPQPLHSISNSIMDHNAHHAAPHVPLYRLSQAQASLRERVAAVRHYYLSPLAYLRIVDACKLYDAAGRCWTDFTGRPTGPGSTSVIAPR